MSLTTNIRVHAQQLALHPNLQILRRARRPLLCGMEQARRSALAHHVHRTAPMGPRVLINGIWYKMKSRRLMCGWPPPGKRKCSVPHKSRAQSCVDGPRLARENEACRTKVACSHVWMAPAWQEKM